MSHEPPDFAACAICERTILRGERLYEYRGEDGEARVVCSLCREEADLRGWLPADEALIAVSSAPEEGGRRWTLRARLSRLAERRGREPEPVPGDREQPRLDEGPRTPERLARTALEFFNAGDQPRKIAGLSRSLGEPRVHAEADLDSACVEVVVAWELSWYRWEVTPDGRVRQVGRGSEIEELPEGDRVWNAAASEDGRLRLAEPGGGAP